MHCDPIAPSVSVDSPELRRIPILLPEIFADNRELSTCSFGGCNHALSLGIVIRLLMSLYPIAPIPTIPKIARAKAGRRIKTGRTVFFAC